MLGSFHFTVSVMSAVIGVRKENAIPPWYQPRNSKSVFVGFSVFLLVFRSQQTAIQSYFRRQYRMLPYNRFCQRALLQDSPHLLNRHRENTPTALHAIIAASVHANAFASNDVFFSYCPPKSKAIVHFLLSCTFQDKCHPSLGLFCCILRIL